MPFPDRAGALARLDAACAEETKAARADQVARTLFASDRRIAAERCAVAMRGLNRPDL